MISNEKKKGCLVFNWDRMFMCGKIKTVFLFFLFCFAYQITDWDGFLNTVCLGRGGVTMSNWTEAVQRCMWKKEKRWHDLMAKKKEEKNGHRGSLGPLSAILVSPQQLSALDCPWSFLDFDGCEVEQRQCLRHYRAQRLNAGRITWAVWGQDSYRHFQLINHSLYCTSSVLRLDGKKWTILA